MSLVYGAVGIFERFDQLAFAAAGVLHELRAVFACGSRLLLGLTRVVRIAALRAEVQDSDSVT